MKNRAKLLIAVILMIITLASISFAAFFVSKNQTSDNKVLSGCFDTSFTENSASINMTKALPLTNEQGLNTNPYSFTISNTCSINADYTVLLNIKENSFSENYISYNYSGNEVNILNTAQVNNNIPSGFAKSYILGSGTLKRGKSETINIRLWLNELADYQNMTNKTFEAEIQVVSTVSPNQQYGDVTLAYTLNGEETNMTVAELENAGYEMKTITCSEGGAYIVNDENNQKSIHFSSLPAECTVDFQYHGILPIGYKQIEYIQSSGNQYIKDETFTTAQYRTYMDIMLLSYSSTAISQTGTYGPLFYSRAAWGNGNSNNFIGTSGDNSGTLWAYYGGKTHSGGFTFSLNTRYTIDMNGIVSNSYLKINNNIVTNNNTYTQKEANTPLIIFGVERGQYSNSKFIYSNNDDVIYNGNLRLYELIIYDASGNELRHYYPTKRTIDNKYGLYDTITQTFFPNRGSGNDFTGGPEVQ